jgi:hypothetical protein
MNPAQAFEAVVENPLLAQTGEGLAVSAAPRRRDRRIRRGARPFPQYGPQPRYKAQSQCER